ncbi:MAG: polysaccharide deacetylase family protein [Flavobacteriales bacterium]|nr:polysaccharide deacetylase family protein [Flavobacteriales bacterium]
MKKIFILFALLPLLSFAQKSKVENADAMTWVQGGINRGDRSEKKITLVFTSDGYTDGFQTIRATLKKHGIKGAFFFTGNFYRLEKCAPIVKALKKDGHYLGPHSDKHLLWCAWEKRDSLLVDKVQLIKDVMDNYAEMARFGIKLKNAPFMIPPYEYYNAQTAVWANDLGVQFVNFSPGTGSNADYTTPDARNYRSSQLLFDNILKYEDSEKDGLNGYFLMIHFGTDPKRTDKLYDRMDELITELQKRGYRFVPITEQVVLKK